MSKPRIIKSLGDVPRRFGQHRKIPQHLRHDKCHDGLFGLVQKPDLFIELGTQYGVMAQRACHYLPDTTRIYCVDTWPVSRQFVEHYADGNLNRWSWAKNVEPWLGTKIFGVQSDTVDAADLFDDGSVDVCFVDADHESHAVLRDSLAWWPKVKKGGWLTGHDVTGEWGPKVLAGVKAFMQYIERKDWEIRELYGNAIFKESRPIAKCWCIQK